MEIDKKPNQEKTIENSEKNILFRFPIFNKTKPYLWLKAVLPEKDEYQDIYRIAFNASFFKTLNINVRVFREDLHLLEPYFKTDIDKIKSFVMVLPNQKHMFVNKVETILQLNVVNPTKDHTESIDYLKIDKYQFEEMDTNIIIINRVINGIATNPCVIFASSQYTWEAFLNRLVKRKKILKGEHVFIRSSNIRCKKE